MEWDRKGGKEDRGRKGSAFLPIKRAGLSAVSRVRKAKAIKIVTWL